MKSSLFIAAVSAALASAGPLGKREIETDWVTRTVTQTIWADEVPTSTPQGFIRAGKPTTTSSPPPVVSTSSSSQPPPPPPTSSSSSEPAPPPVSSPTPSPQPPSSGSGGYEDAAVSNHNNLRMKHGAQGLTWDASLASSAFELAKSCNFAHDTSIGGGGYGQNLAISSTSDNTDKSKNAAVASHITDSWYSEVSKFANLYGSENPGQSSNFGDWGHFTQLVWKSSTKVGCATFYCDENSGALSGFNSFYTVCNYASAGNMGGQYAENVLPPTS